MAATGILLNPGDVVPGTKYRVVKSLGAGGMGIVYQVVKPPNIGGVIKLMSTELTQHKEHLERFHDEVRILGQLEHPNIVRVYDHDALPDGTPFYVMELLSGRTVRDVLSMMGRVRPRVAYEVTRQLLEALQCVHTNSVPIIHRDIKPENIFLHAPKHGEPVVKLIDFGVSAVADRKDEGGFVGTWSYAAPEQIRGETPTPATDLYAVGLVLYEMLAGEGPFDHHDDWTKISKAQLQEMPAPVSKFAPWVPASIVALIASALAKDPKQRPRDAYAFAERLFELEWASDGKDPRDLTIEGPSSPDLSPTRSAPVFAPRKHRPDTPPIVVKGNGPLSLVLSTVTSATPPPGASSSKMAAAAPAPDRLGNDVPLIGVPPESVRSGPTWQGVGGGARVEPTSPDAQALLAGLGADPRKPPSKRERESGPDVESPRVGQVVIRAGRQPSDPHEVHGPTTPRPVPAVTRANSNENEAPVSASPRDTFSSQQSDPHRGGRVGARSRLPLFLSAAALLLSGLVVATIVIVRGSRTDTTTTNSTNVTNANANANSNSNATPSATTNPSSVAPPPASDTVVTATPSATTSTKVISPRPTTLKTTSTAAAAPTNSGLPGRNDYDRQFKP